MALTSLTNLQPLHVHSVGVSTFDGSVSVGGTLTYEDVTNVDAIGIITARSGLKVTGGQLDVGSNIKLGNAGVITATSFVGSGSGLTGVSGVSVANQADNRLLSATGTTDALNAEANLTFDGTDLTVTGSNTKIIVDSRGSNGDQAHLQLLAKDASGNNNFGELEYDGDGDFSIASRGSGAANNSIVFKTTSSNVERLRITSAGRVGIGTDSPESLLQVGNSLVFNGTELYPVDGVSGSNVGHRLNYRRNPPQSRTNTGSASQRYYKIGEIVLNGSESAEINIYGTVGYSAGTESAGKTTIIIRATNASTLVGFWYEETLGNLNLSDVRWKYTGSNNVYELWVQANNYSNIAPFVRCTGNGYTSFNTDTGSNTAPSGSTALSTYNRKIVGTTATIRYNPTDTTFHQNIKMDNGKGIDFSATSNGSGSSISELLDDYEEGSWTPQWNFSSSNYGPVYTHQEGGYTKIGRQVTVYFSIYSTSVNGSTGSIRIGGLPFTDATSPVSYPATAGAFPIFGFNGWAGEYIAMQVVNGLIELYGVVKSTTSYDSISHSEVNGGGALYLKGQVTYNV